MQDVLVIGGGVVGASAAFHLAEAGVRVTMVDRHDAGHATAAGAGIIAPGTSMRPLPAFFTLASDAVGYYPLLIGRLADLGAGDTRFDVVGKLFVATNEAEYEDLDRVQQLLDERYREGMPNIGETRRIDAKEARALFPPIGDIPGAIHIPAAARVDGNYLRNALVTAAQKLGATAVDGVVSIAKATDESVDVVLNGDPGTFDRVIVATGAWTNTALGPLGVSVPVAPQKGQIMHVSMGDTDTTRWPIIGTSHDQYILTFGPNRVVFGATRETGSGYDLRITPGGLQSVTNEALGVAPGLANSTLEEVRVGLRPLSDDGLPFIDRVKGHEAVIVSTGHGPSGLQLGPWSGLLAAELATGKAPSSDISPFTLDRVVTA